MTSARAVCRGDGIGRYRVWLGDNTGSRGSWIGTVQRHRNGEWGVEEQAGSRYPSRSAAVDSIMQRTRRPT